MTRQRDISTTEKTLTILVVVVWMLSVWLMVAGGRTIDPEELITTPPHVIEEVTAHDASD